MDSQKSGGDYVEIMNEFHFLVVGDGVFFEGSFGRFDDFFSSEPVRHDESGKDSDGQKEEDGQVPEDGRIAVYPAPEKRHP